MLLAKGLAISLPLLACVWFAWGQLFLTLSFRTQVGSRVSHQLADGSPIDSIVVPTAKSPAASGDLAMELPAKQQAEAAAPPPAASPPLVAKSQVPAAPLPRRYAPLNWSGSARETGPRYSNIDASLLVWRGNSPVKKSATMTAHDQPPPIDAEGKFVAVLQPSPECTQACESGVGCYKLVEGKGRMGNIISELAHTWNYLNKTRWRKGIEFYPGYMGRVFEFPRYVCLDRLETFDAPDRKPAKLPRCDAEPKVGSEYTEMCRGATGAEHQALLRKYVAPYFSRALKECLATERGVDEERLLTVHLRGEDIFGQHVLTGDYESERYQNWMNAARIVTQSPCSFLQKLLAENDFTRVLIVTSQDLMNPCVKWYSERRESLVNIHGRPVEWELQTGTLVEDSCALMKAKRLLLSESSMSNNLALMGGIIGSDHHAYGLSYQFTQNWLLRCPTPNVTVHKYKRDPDPVSRQWPKTIPPIIEWLTTLGPEKFREQRVC